MNAPKALQVKPTRAALNHPRRAAGCLKVGRLPAPDPGRAALRLQVDCRPSLLSHRSLRCRIINQLTSIHKRGKYPMAGAKYGTNSGAPGGPLGTSLKLPAFSILCANVVHG